MTYCPNCECRSCGATKRQRAKTERTVNEARALQSAARLLFLCGASKDRAAKILGVSPQRLHSAYSSLRSRASVPIGVMIASLDPHEQRLCRVGALPVRGDLDRENWWRGPLPSGDWPR